jgi:crossover junction endodeoxyribonuclease RuvC
VRVLGVDPGLTRCGLGVVDGSPGRATLVAFGVATTPATDPLGHRLVALERVFEAWLDLHRPDAVAVERVFSQANVRTVMGTAQAGAVAVTCAARRGLPVVLHTPSEVKAAVTGSGRADKAQVGAMVARLLSSTRLRDPPTPPMPWRWPSARSGGAPRRPGCEPLPPRGRASTTVIAASRAGGRAHRRGRRRRGRAGGPGGAHHRGTRARLRVGSTALLATSLVVAEDSLTLYGFADDDERALFELLPDRLRGRAAAGPGRAHGAHARAVRRALVTEDLARLCLVPAVGARAPADGAGAQGQGRRARRRGSARAGAQPAGWRDTLSQALVGLGWSAAQADEVVVAWPRAPRATRRTCRRCSARRSRSCGPGPR